MPAAGLLQSWSAQRTLLATDSGPYLPLEAGNCGAGGITLRSGSLPQYYLPIIQHGRSLRGDIRSRNPPCALLGNTLDEAMNWPRCDRP
jgi:hypothetical protein